MTTPMSLDPSMAISSDIRARPLPHPANSSLKRLLDVVIALAALVFLAPLLLMTILLIRADSKGPIFFCQRRTGMDGRPFKIVKFRTMHVLEDGDAVMQASRGDKRVTRIGVVLRRASIDELPQLLNVIRGEMSIVGPRPHAVAHDLHYAELLANYRSRFRSRPGITGLAQVSGLRGETPVLEDMARRVEADNIYIDTWSLLNDLNIIFKTAYVVVVQRSAY